MSCIPFPIVPSGITPNWRKVRTCSPAHCVLRRPAFLSDWPGRSLPLMEAILEAPTSDAKSHSDDAWSMPPMLPPSALMDLNHILYNLRVTSSTARLAVQQHNRPSHIANPACGGRHLWRAVASFASILLHWLMKPSEGSQITTPTAHFRRVIQDQKKVKTC
eukprot:s857_g3.t1